MDPVKKDDIQTNQPKGLHGLLWLGWMALALGPFFFENASTFRVIMESIAVIGVALLFWALALGLGWRCLRCFGLFESSATTLRDCLSRLMLSCGAGLGLLAAIVLAVGTWAGVNISTFLFTFLILIAAVATAWRDLWRELRNALQLSKARTWKTMEIAGVALIAGIICLQLPAALTPTLYPDTWRYHFGLTKLFEQAGRISVIPDFAEANIASNWQMIYLPLLIFRDGVTAQVFNWMTLPLMALAIALAARPHRWMAAALTLVTTPLLLGVTGLGNNDLGAAFFAALMWLALGEFQISNFKFQISKWFLAGIFGGLAVGTKYNAMLAVLPVFILSLFLQRPKKERAWEGIRFLLGAFVGYLPWFVRNGIGTGDPFYPILCNWLPWCGAEGRWVSEHYSGELSTYARQMEGIWHLLLAPWCATVADHRYFESDIGVVYWCMAPLMIWAAWRRPKTRIIIGAFLLGGVMWALTAQVPRFLAPLMPAAALAVSEGWGEWTDNGKRLKIRWIWIPLLAINLWQTLTATAGFSDPYHFLLGGMTREEYLARQSPLYRIARLANKHPDGKVLLLGEEGVFVFQNPVMLSGPFDRKWFVEQVAASMNSKHPMNELTERLRQADISLLCINAERMEGLDRRFGYVSWPSREAYRHFRRYLEREAALVGQEGSIRLFLAGVPGKPLPDDKPLK